MKIDGLGMNDFWFKPHRVSVAAPATWEGWLSILALGLLQILIVKDFSAKPLLFWSASASAVFMFVWLAWIKTDGEWRMGGQR